MRPGLVASLRWRYPDQVREVHGTSTEGISHPARNETRTPSVLSAAMAVRRIIALQRVQVARRINQINVAAGF